MKDLLTVPDTVAKVCDYLENNIDNEKIHGVLPHLLSAFQNNPFGPRREFVRIYWKMIEILYLSTQGGDDDFAIFNDLVVWILTLGCTEDKYKEIVDIAIDLWQTYEAPTKIDWLVSATPPRRHIFFSHGTLQGIDATRGC